MASANDMGVTETSASAIAIKDKIIQDVLRAEGVLANSVMNLSARAVKGPNSVALLKSTAFTAAAKVENTAATKQKLTISADTISLNQYYQVVCMLEDVAALQSDVSNLGGFIFKEIAGSFVTQLESALYTVLAAGSVADPDHRITFDSATTLAEADILEAIKLLDSQNVPFSDRYLAIHPNQKEDLMAITRFTQMNGMGQAGADALQKGMIGEVHGLKVLLSTNVTADKSLVYHSSAVGFAVQQGVQLRADRANAEEFGTDYSGLIVYGTVTADSGKRNVLIESA